MATNRKRKLRGVAGLRKEYMEKFADAGMESPRMRSTAESLARIHLNDPQAAQKVLKSILSDRDSVVENL